MALFVSFLCPFRALLYGMALLAAKWWCYMGHLAANNVLLYGDYLAITVIEHYWAKI